MIPDSVEIVLSENEILPSKTYKLDLATNRIMSTIEGVEAVYQYIQKVFNTDKYAHEIYNWYYGNELYKLEGKHYDYVIAEIPRLVREAIINDDRIKDVTSFKFNQLSVDSLEVAYEIITVYGTLSNIVEVTI